MATDNFTGTDFDQLTTYSTNWTLNGGDFDIISNALASDTANNNGAYWNADSFADDQYSEALLVALAVSYIGVGVRHQSGANSYYGYYTNGSADYLFRVVANSWTQIGSAGTEAAATDTIRLEIEGTTLRPMLNGSTSAIGTSTDATFSSGSVGVTGYLDGATSRIDDWDGDSITAGATALPFRMRY